MRPGTILLYLFTFVLIISTVLPGIQASGFSSTAPQTGTTPITPVIVATPNPDGSIYHIVQYGQTLEMISLAYGILISDIRKLNGIPEGISDIYEGQRLVIRVAMPPTETPTLTSTAPVPTRTPRNTTPIITPTPLPSPTNTPVSILPRGTTIHRQTVGIALLGLGSLGLITIGFFQYAFPKIKRH